MKDYGANNVKIIDYVGLLTEGKDISYEIFCGIMGIACGPSVLSVLGSMKSHNVGQDSISTTNEVANIVYSYAISKKCIITLPHNKMVELIHAVKTYEWPAIHFSEYNETYSRKYIDMSKYYDNEIRQNYSSNILYGNRTANNAVTESAFSTFKSIDTKKLSSA